VPGDGDRHGGVPREDVVLGQVVLPRHPQRDPLKSLDGWPRESGALRRRAEREHGGRRQVTMEFLHACKIANFTYTRRENLQFSNHIIKAQKITITQ
jgi:hypothetical protein